VVEPIRFQVAAEPGPAAATLLAPVLARADRDRGRARLAVAGGSALAALGALRRTLDPGVWRRLLLTWVDERCVSQDDPQSNRGAAWRDGWLDPAAPPALELPLYLDGETPETACARVAGGLSGPFQGGLDALLLGMGEDGHIASLFPDRPWATTADVFAVLDSPKPPPRRITLALPLLAAVPAGVLVAAGAGKLEALKRLAGGDPALPAIALRGLTVITDQDLAGIRRRGPAAPDPS
jgi:6-phosphogluconolactonase